MDIGTKLAQLEKRLAKVERSSRLASASLDDTSLSVRDADGGLRALIGQQADGTTAVNVVNGPPPPMPSAPIVAPVIGGITVSWDGQFADSATLPLDWSRIEVHASPIDGFTPLPATLQTTIETPQGATVVVSADGPLYVRLLARTTSGVASDATGPVGPTGPAPVVAQDVLDGIVTTTKLADDAVTAAKVAAGAIGTTEIADDAVTTPKLIAGAVQAGKIAADAVQAGNVAAGAVTAREIAALAVTAGKIAANAVTAGTIAAGAVTTNALTVGVAQSLATKLSDAMGDATLWTQVADTGTWSILSGVSDAVAGGTVLQASGPCTVERVDKIPFDPSVLYKVMYRVRTTTAPTAGTATVYLGVEGLAADGTTRVNTTGGNTVSGQHYVATANTAVTAGTAWTTYTGYIQGTAATGTGTASPDPKTPGLMHTSTRYIRPLARLLFGATGGVMQIDQVTVETVPTGVVNTVNIADGAITTGKLSAGSVDATALKADAITGKTITGGTITGTDITGVNVTGSTVTGGTVQTGTSGGRVVLTPTPPAGISTRPSVLVYSGATGEIIPGVLNAGTVTSGSVTRPLTVLTSPATDVNPSGFAIQAGLNLDTAKPGTIGGRFYLLTCAPDSSSVIGNAYVLGDSSATTTGQSTLTMGAVDGGASSPPTSTVKVTGTTITFTTQGVAHTLDDTTLGLNADLSLNGVAQGRGHVTSVSLTTNAPFTSETAIMTTPSVTFENGRAYKISIWGLQQWSGTQTYALYRIRKGTVTGTIYKDQMRVPGLNAAGVNGAVSLQTILTNTSGANITTALCFTGNATQSYSWAANSSNVSYLTVEDVGLAADWPGQPIT